MSIPEMKGLKKTLAYNIRLKTAIHNRDYRDAVKGVGYTHSVETYNNNDIQRMPDRVGITLFYPSKENTTHAMTKTFTLSLGTREFAKQVKKMCKLFKKKLPKD